MKRGWLKRQRLMNPGTSCIANGLKYDENFRVFRRSRRFFRKIPSQLLFLAEISQMIDAPDRAISSEGSGGTITPLF